MSNKATLELKLAKMQREYELLKFEKEALVAEVADLKRRMFGPKSEKIDPAQMALAVEAEIDDGALEEEVQPEATASQPASPRRGGGRRPSPENLPIERVVIDVPESERVGMEKIREDITEEIDYRPSQFIRRQIVRPVYASKSKDQAPVQALAPKRVIPGSSVGTGLIAHILVSRFCDHLPYYRLQQCRRASGSAAGPPKNVHLDGARGTIAQNRLRPVTGGGPKKWIHPGGRDTDKCDGP